MAGQYSFRRADDPTLGFAYVVPDVTAAHGRGRALGSGEVKFFGQVLPSAKKVTYNIQIKRVLKGKLNMAIADGSVSVDGREIYTAEGLRVGVFTSTDNF